MQPLRTPCCQVRLLGVWHRNAPACLYVCSSCCSCVRPCSHLGRHARWAERSAGARKNTAGATATAAAAAATSQESATAPTTAATRQRPTAAAVAAAQGGGCAVAASAGAGGGIVVAARAAREAATILLDEAAGAGGQHLGARAAAGRAAVATAGRAGAPVCAGRDRHACQGRRQPRSGLQLLLICQCAKVNTDGRAEACLRSPWSARRPRPAPAQVWVQESKSTYYGENATGRFGGLICESRRAVLVTSAKCFCGMSN